MFMRNDFIFLHVDSLMYQSVNFSWKIAVENTGFVFFTYFCAQQKISFRLQIRISFKNKRSFLETSK